VNGRSRAALAIGITAAAAFGGAGGAALEKGAPHHQARTTDSAQGPATTTSTTEPATTSTTARVVLDPVFATQATTSTTATARTIATTGQVRATSTTLPAPWTCTVTAPATETYGGTYTAQVTTSRPAVHVVGQAVDASASPPPQTTPATTGATDSAGHWALTYTLPAPRPGQPAGTTPWRVTVRGTTDGYPRCEAAVRVSRP
jgi:hypothetical protein